MSDIEEFESYSAKMPEDDGADAIAGLAVIAVAVLAAIHFVYTGGLPAFFAAVL